MIGFNAGSVRQRFAPSASAKEQRNNMGCDIHCYIEYKHPESEIWSDFGGRINPGRNYDLFAKLAGVRNYNEKPPAIPPRGMPADAAYAADGDNKLFITETEGAGCVTPATAAEYVKHGSVYVNGSDDKPTWVTHPDWHSHSWLTTEEYAKSVEDSGEFEYLAILAAMQSFEENGCAARLVFWFDN